MTNPVPLAAGSFAACLAAALLAGCATPAPPLPSSELAAHLKAVDWALAASAQAPEAGFAFDAVAAATEAATLSRLRAEAASGLDRRILADIAASVETCRQAVAAVAARAPDADLLRLSAARETCALAAATDALLAR
ncbi:MAG: hypothetical protein SNJ79_02535 [Sphingomonadaceae bacterium]